MELLLLFLTAILVARYADKRSAAITVAHCVLFVLLLILSLFTTNLSFVQAAMAKICGSDNYLFFREVLYTPCIWIYSANAVICFVELILLLVITISATIRAAKRLLKRRKPFIRKAGTDHNSKVFPVRFRAEGNYIFLKYCRILD